MKTHLNQEASVAAQNTIIKTLHSHLDSQPLGPLHREKKHIKMYLFSHLANYYKCILTQSVAETH